MKHNVLTTRKVETAKGPARYSDGAGLYLQVSQFGTKAWVFRYDVGGRTREMGLGSARTVSLRLARELAHEMRQHLLRGTDPIELRRDKKGRHARKRPSASSSKMRPVTIMGFTGRHGRTTRAASSG